MVFESRDSGEYGGSEYDVDVDMAFENRDAAEYGSSEYEPDLSISVDLDRAFDNDIGEAGVDADPRRSECDSDRRISSGVSGLPIPSNSGRRCGSSK